VDSELDARRHGSANAAKRAHLAVEVRKGAVRLGLSRAAIFLDYFLPVAARSNSRVRRRRHLRPKRSCRCSTQHTAQSSKLCQRGEARKAVRNAICVVAILFTHLTIHDGADLAVEASFTVGAATVAGRHHGSRIFVVT